MKSFALVLLAAASLFAANDFSNRRAPGFSLADSKFQQHDTQDYRGKVLIVDIMQTTCPVCTHLADTLVQVKQKYGDKVGILSITTLPDSYEKGDRFAAEHKISWPILFDSGQVIMSYLKVTPSNPQVHFPHLFIIDANGMIRYDFEGDETAAEISASIDKLLK
jgi:peroxiredoxin